MKYKKTIYLSIPLFTIILLVYFHIINTYTNNINNSINNTNNKIQNINCNFILNKVIDGDTIEIKKCTNTGCIIQTIRYIGIDTPELHKKEYPAQYLAYEAYIKNKELLNTKNICIKTKTYEIYDRYNRLLAYVFNLSGSFINLELLKSGYARFADYNDKNIIYKDEFLKAQQYAQINNLGIWNNNNICNYNNKYDKINWNDIDKYVNKYVFVEIVFTYFISNNYNTKYFVKKGDNKYILITNNVFELYFNIDKKNNKKKFTNKNILISGVVKKTKNNYYIEIITPWNICIK